MAKQTFTFTTARGRVFKRTSETKTYTHVVISGPDDCVTVRGWCGSEELAHKKASTYNGSKGVTNPRVVPVDQRISQLAAPVGRMLGIGS